MTLQNHFGDREFPVRPRWRHRTEVTRQRARRRPGWSRLRLVLVVVGVALAGAAGYGIAALLSADLPCDAQQSVCLAGMAAAMLVTVCVVMIRDRSLPLREQRRYRALSVAAEPTPRQLQLLALDAHGDYELGGWNGSLAFRPSWAEMPETVRARFQMGRAGQPFITLPLEDVGTLRNFLDAQARITGPTDVELLINDVVASRSLSHRFAAALRTAEGDRVAARLSGLTGVDEFTIAELSLPAAERPATQLWPADAQRLIAIIRMSVVAEFTTPERAWELIERVATMATAVVDSWDEYWANVRLGVAFASDSRQAVSDFDERHAEFLASAWPALELPFPEHRPVQGARAEVR
ncbi:MAG: DUF1266 domain-containing protein [Mycetocola sp.]